MDLVIKRGKLISSVSVTRLTLFHYKLGAIIYSFQLKILVQGSDALLAPDYMPGLVFESKIIYLSFKKIRILRLLIISKTLKYCKKIKI